MRGIQKYIDQKAPIILAVRIEVKLGYKQLKPMRTCWRAV